MTTESAQLLVNRDLICRLYDVWSEMPDDKHRRALDPIELGARLLPHVALLRALPGNFRCDLAGERAGELSRTFRRGQTAHSDAEMAGNRLHVFHLMREVAESRRPGARFAGIENRAGNRRRCFSMVLPLSIRDGKVGDLLIGIWSVASVPGEIAETGPEDVPHVGDLIAELRQTHRKRPRFSVRRIAFGGESLASC